MPSNCLILCHPLLLLPSIFPSIRVFSNESVLQCSGFFIVQLSHPYMTTGKTMVLSRWAFVGKVVSLLFNILCRLVISFLSRKIFMCVHTYSCVLAYIVIYVSENTYTCIFWCYLVIKSCLTLCDTMDCSPPGSFVCWILQARILEWAAIPFSRGSSWPRDQTTRRFFTTEPPGEPLYKYISYNKCYKNWVIVFPLNFCTDIMNPVLCL